jgi:hypothetical protein
MKAKNQRITFKSVEELFAFKKEIEWMGRYSPSYDLGKLELVVSPFPEKYKKKSDEENKARARRAANTYDDDDYEAEYAQYSR